MLGYSLTHSLLLTHSLTYSLTHSLTHLLTHSLTISLTYSLTYLLTHSLTHLLTHSLNHSLTHSLTHLLTHSLTHSYLLTHSLTYLLSVVKSYDMELPAIATCDDYWESAYRKVNRDLMGSEHLLSVEKDELLNKQKRIITRLLSVIKDNEIPFDEDNFMQSFDVVVADETDRGGGGSGSASTHSSPVLFEI